MAKKEDLRIVRTRSLLSNTLLDMMEEESIEKISVIDLCNRAMVNRATFYAHFEDKYHLLNFALEDLKDNIYAKFTKDHVLTNPAQTLSSLLRMAVEFFVDKHNHIYNILTHNRNDRMVSCIEESISKSIKYQLSKYKDTHDTKVPIPVLANFISGGMVNTALYCIDNETKYTREDFLGYINLLDANAYFIKKSV